MRKKDAEEAIDAADKIANFVSEKIKFEWQYNQFNPDNAVEKKRSHKGTKTLRDTKKKNNFSFKFNVWKSEKGLPNM